MYTNLISKLPQFPIQKYVAPCTAILSIITAAPRQFVNPSVKMSIKLI